MTQIVCDICRKPFKRETLVTQLTCIPMHIKKKQLFSSLTKEEVTIKYVDLCQICERELADFVQNLQKSFQREE